LAVLAHEGTYPILYGSTGIPVGSGYRRGYVARPDQVGRFPGVILLPGLSGLGPHERDLCRLLARRGFATVAVDLHAKGQADPLLAYHALSDGEAIRDLDETYDFLQSDDVPWVMRDGAGLLGLDVGGRFALITGAMRGWVLSVVVVSTPLTGDEDRTHPVAGLLSHIRPAVLGLYGSRDDLISPDSVDEAQRRNPAGQWLLYDGAGHGFLDSSSDTYDSGAANDALARTIGLFMGTLPAPSLEVG
jgi:carboxymethylenebutenolidase